jgi:predicted transcriptional regulator
MANSLEPQASTNADDEAEVLAAIDEGIADADADRVTPVEEAKKKISQWITESSSPTVR